MSSTLPDSPMGNLIPLLAIVIVGFALVAVIGAFPNMRASWKDRAGDLREFVGAPPAAVVEDLEETSDAAGTSAAQTPWGNLSLDIYDESRTD